MSRYLIDRIVALANVQVHTDSEVVELDGEPEIALATSTVTNRKTGETRIFPIRGLFLFIGADPNTGWLQSCGMQLDEKGFVATELSEMDGAIWRSFKRKPLPLETSVPCVFAIGDVRANSTKRVAAAVGEGAAVVAQLHSILTKRN
jgi:thioredoxin reductase (NADPH)